MGTRNRHFPFLQLVEARAERRRLARPISSKSLLLFAVFVTVLAGALTLFWFLV